MSYWKTVRVLFAAFGLCVLAFVAGVAGDLSMAAAPTTHGQRVTLLIPQDAPRAHPLPPLPRTAAAEATPIRAISRAHALLPSAKPHSLERVHSVAKIDLDHAPKPENEPANGGKGE